jgi:hypothetical protein
MEPVPNSITSPNTFDTDMDALLPKLDPWAAAATALAAAMTAAAAGGAMAIPYTFSTTTTDSDPGAGTLRLDNATQNAATTIRADLLGADGSTWTDVLNTFDDSTNTVKGSIRLTKTTDATKFLIFNVSALASPSGYKNITVAISAYSAASPFSNGDALVMHFSRAGDVGATGATGPTSFPVPTAQGGTVDAITLTFSPTTTLTNGAFYSWISAGPNTIVNPTVNPDGTGVTTLKTRGARPLRIGDTGVAGAVNIGQYHSSGTYMELINPHGREMAGYLATSTGSTVTLTNASARSQKITATAVAVNVVAPDATTLEVNDEFLVENAGQYLMPFQSNGGALVGWILPGQTVRFRLYVNGTAAGTWKAMTGDINADSGLSWFGAPGPQTGVSTPRAVTQQLSDNFGIVNYYDGSSYSARGYSLIPFAIGAAATVLSGANVGDCTAVDTCAPSTTQEFIIYSNASGANTYCRTMTLNTSTLALTLAAQIELDNTATSVGGVSCDDISSSLVYVTYNDAGSIITCGTVSIDGSGVCTENASANLATGGAATGMSSRVLSSTLAHSLYWDGSTTKINRVVLNGTSAPTPGTPVTVTSRKLFAGGNQCDLGKASATASWTVLTSVGQESGNFYGEHFADTGSTITVTETALLVQTSTNNTVTRVAPKMFSASDTNQCGLIVKYDATTGALSFAMAHLEGTAVRLSGDLQQPANLAATPHVSTTVQFPENSMARMRFTSGVGLFTANKMSGSHQVLQPLAVA